MKKPKIILASASPRRAELLSLAEIDFVAAAADISEEPLDGELPADHVLRLAIEKGDAVASKIDADFFISADTVVTIDNLIIGKPADSDDACRMLKMLSDRTHSVITGYYIFDKKNNRSASGIVITDVLFKKLDDGEIKKYVATGCPLDKAGGYAIQGGALHFVKRIDGSYTNVVGLPMTEVYEALRELDAI